jgi:HEAT repeat protein
LGRFLEDERVVPILGDIIKDDSNLTVRKKAIYLLGKSKDPRAVDILEGIVGLK